jgi:GT2 family glycosyltransferase
MLISKKLFDESGGFNEDFMPILEDVEFSHKLRRRGVRLKMEPSIQVGHIFNYNLWRSLKNAFRKSLYWTMYSIKNRDLLADSGTASVELKADVLSWCVCTILLALFVLTGNFAFLAALAIVCGLNMLVNRRFLALIFKATGPAHALWAVLYYTALYPLPVALGGLVGAMRST